MTETKFDSIEVVAAPLIVNSKGEILLIKSPKWGDIYLFPGGHVDRGETIFNTVVREGKEETGLDLEALYCVNVYELIYDPTFKRKTHFISFHIVCKALTDEVFLDGKELHEYIWIDPRKALDLPNVRVKDSIENYINGVKINVTKEMLGK